MLVFTFESWNCDLVAQCSLRKSNGYVAIQIMLAAFKEFMILNVENNIKVARRATLATRIALTGDSQFGVGVNAGRNFELKSLLADNASVAVTGRAAILDDLPSPVTVTARAGDAEETLLESNLAIAVARRTRRGT